MTLQDFLDKMKTIREKDVYIYEYFDQYEIIYDQLNEVGSVSPDDNDFICKISSEQRLIASAFLKDKLAFAEVEEFIVYLSSVYVFLKFSEVQK